MRQQHIEGPCTVAWVLYWIWSSICCHVSGSCKSILTLKNSCLPGVGWQTWARSPIFVHQSSQIINWERTTLENWTDVSKWYSSIDFCWVTMLYYILPSGPDKWSPKRNPWDLPTSAMAQSWHHRTGWGEAALPVWSSPCPPRHHCHYKCWGEDWYRRTNWSWWVNLAASCYLYLLRVNPEIIFSFLLIYEYKKQFTVFTYKCSIGNIFC